MPVAPTPLGTAVPVGGTIATLAKVSTPFDTNTAYAYQAVYTTMGETAVSFVLAKQQNILLVTSTLCFLNGGSATFCLIKAQISATNTANCAAANDANGHAMVATEGCVSPSVNGLSVTSTTSFPCPAGTWYGMLQYEMIGGATTTLTNNSCGVFVYGMG